MTKCSSCGKMFEGRVYSIRNRSLTSRVCSGCYDIYLLFRREIRYGRKKPLINLMSSAMADGKHCISCIHFNMNRIDRCFKECWTGLGEEHVIRYPFSYANYGCRNYRRYTDE